MEGMRQAFLALPDTVIITDAYWYILDFNHADPFDSLRRGVKLTRYMPDCTSPLEDGYRCGGRMYSRKVAPVREHGHHVGYIVYLVDITRKMELVEELSARSERTRVARNIHDDAGHAITALHAISQMCLQIGDGDPERYAALLAEGRAICEKVRSGHQRQVPRNLHELLEEFERKSLFPVKTVVHGEGEGPFIRSLYGVIGDICREAYFNTLSHSLAENLLIEADVGTGWLRLRVFDDGRFRGGLEPGFGLLTMMEKVRSTGGTIVFHAQEGDGFGIIAEWQVSEDG